MQASAEDGTSIGCGSLVLTAGRVSLRCSYSPRPAISIPPGYASPAVCVVVLGATSVRELDFEELSLEFSFSSMILFKKKKNLDHFTA